MEPEFVGILRENPPGSRAETPVSLERYRERFRSILRNEVLATLLVVGGAITVLVLMAESRGTALLALANYDAFLLIGALIVFGGAVGMIVNWRCPRCRRDLAPAAESLILMFLPKFWIRHCPHCNLRLQ